MSELTTKEVAKKLGVVTLTVRNRAEKLGLAPYKVLLTGKRGRPADLWTLSQVEKLKNA